MAHLFEVTKRVNKGIKPNRDGFLVLGEKGRGRTESLCRLSGPLTEGAVLLNQYGNLIEIEPLKEGEGPGKYALVIIRDQSGYRGGWRLLGPAEGNCPNSSWKPLPHDEYIKLITQARLELYRSHSAGNPEAKELPPFYGLLLARGGNEDLNAPTCYEEWERLRRIDREIMVRFRGPLSRKWLEENPCPLECSDHESTQKWVDQSYKMQEEDEKCPSCGGIEGKHSLVRKPERLGRVVLKGYCAQGDAGRMGGGDEVAILLAPGQGFVISRHGRLYGADDWHQFEWDGENLSCQNRAEWDLSHSGPGSRF